MQTLEKSYAETLKHSNDSMKKTQEINSSAKAMIKQQLETRQQEVRKNNAILYGVVEVDNMSAIEQLNELMKEECFMNGSFRLHKQPINAIRLQPKNPTPKEKPRPIRVEFPDEVSKWEFIKRANATLRQQNIFAKPDESKERRDQQYALRQKIRDLKANGDADGEYRIRNSKIQRKDAESGEWKVMNISSQQLPLTSSQSTTV